VATGRITVAWDPRDLIDRRILLGRVQVENPFVRLQKYENGEWNYRRIFPSGPKRPPRRERGFGDFVVIDTATIHRGALFLTMPWRPADSLSGARRDSAVRYNLARRDAEIRRVPRGYTQTWKWSAIELASPHVRLADPDSAGRVIAVGRLNVAESNPPFRFSNIRGMVRLLGDSAWLDLPHWDTPGSTGSGKGKVVWGSNLPVRYSIRVVGDSVSLNDVAWVYETLPRTGGGKMVLDIRNDPRDLHVLDYAISRMDVRTTDSHLRGNMTFGVGGPVLVVKNVDMEAAPLDFKLIRALNGKPFPYDWAGQITGTAKARGGPVNRFVVDDAQFTFRDANVPGAVTRGSGRGGLDILFPAFTSFRDFDVDVERLDLRTLQFLNPNFPRVNGIVSGEATLDSSWLDVRFRDAAITHRDGPGAPTQMTGSGRVTIGDEFLTYDLDLAAQALSFTTLARSYPAIPVRGTYQGPLRVQGTIADLDLATTLSGPAGTVAVDGHFDLFPTGYAARGHGSVSHLDVRRIGVDTAAPPTDLSAEFEMDLVGDSLANLAGTLAMDVDRSLVDSVRIYSLRSRMRFDGGAFRVDTLHAETAAGTVSAAGGLGLVRARSDSLRYAVTLDSLGGLRRYLTAGRPGAEAGAGASPEPDSLRGRITLIGALAGSTDSLALTGAVSGANVVFGATSAQTVQGDFAISGLPRDPKGQVVVDLDTVTAAGIELAHAAAWAAIEGRDRGSFIVDAVSGNGPRFAAGGDAWRAGDTTGVVLDSVSLTVGENAWRLLAPARISASSAGVIVDTLRLVGERGGRLELGGVLPESGPVAFGIRADSVPLVDVGLLAQASLRLDGTAELDWTIEGPRARPTMAFNGALEGGQFGDVHLERVTAVGNYADRRLKGALALFRDQRAVLNATVSLPVDLALVPVARRALDDPLTGTVRSDSVDLGVLEAFTPAIQRATGSFEVNVDLGGTLAEPTFGGGVTVANGAATLPGLGIRMERLNADVGFSGDSVAVRRLTASTPGERTGSLSLRGGVDLADREHPAFDLTLTANNFHAINKARVANLYLSTNGTTGLRLVGSTRRSRLTGRVLVPTGDIFIPELAGKKVISLDDPEFYRVVDTSLYANRTLLPDAPPAMVRNLSVENVRIEMGEDVWLRSSEANINLGGAVNVTVGRSDRPGADTTQTLFALDGTLNAVRGTYRLNLGLALQRTFEVERGTLQFFGDPDLNPTLDISAIHTVRQAGSLTLDRDVRIRVQIGGTLARPTLTLSSADPTLQLSESDAISYLITGQPSFVVARNSNEYKSQAAGVLLPSIGSYFGDKVASSLGLDVVQIETSGTGTGDGLFSSATLGNTRLGGGVQIGSRTFVRANFGLCPLVQGFGGGGTGGGGPTTPGGFDYASFINSIGAKLEYRFSGSYSASIGLDPPTNLLTCSTQGATTRSFVPTPQQFGLDFTRRWEF
jgi:translocation and assembly module TamB